MVKEITMIQVISLEEYIKKTGCTTSAEKFRSVYKVFAVKVLEDGSNEFISKDEYNKILMNGVK
jgi:hypothetical protein